MGSLWSSFRSDPVTSMSWGDAGAGVFECFVQRPNIAGAEGQSALALDQLEEEGAPLVGGPGEDLEHLPPPIAVGQHVEFAQHVERNRKLAQPSFESLVVTGRGDEELHTPPSER